MGRPIEVELDQVVLDPRFLIPEGGPGNPWTYQLDWDQSVDGAIFSSPPNLTPPPIVQINPAKALNLTDYTIKISITEQSPPPPFSLGMQLRFGAVFTPFFTGTGDHFFTVLNALGVVNLFIKPPASNTRNLSCTIRQIEIYEEIEARFLWKERNFGIDEKTFFEIFDYGGGKIIYRYANHQNATNMMILTRT